MDSELAEEDLLLVFPVLDHLIVDTKSLIEERCDLLDSSLFSKISPSYISVKGGRVSRLMIYRIHDVSDNACSESKVVNGKKKLNF